jgi:hypothetical protein
MEDRRAAVAGCDIGGFRCRERFVLSVVWDEVDFGKITGTYRSELGQPPFNPIMLTARNRPFHCIAGGVVRESFGNLNGYAKTRFISTLMRTEAPPSAGKPRHKGAVRLD